MLEDASALVRSEAGKTWEDEVVPDVIRTVCMSAAKRAFLNPDGVTATAIDGHSASFATGSPDVYLTKAEKAAIRKSAGRTGLWTQSTTRSEYTIEDDGSQTIHSLDTPDVIDPLLDTEDDDPIVFA